MNPESLQTFSVRMSCQGLEGSQTSPCRPPLQALGGRDRVITRSRTLLYPRICHRAPGVTPTSFHDAEGAQCG